jgi:hypothetical protein
MAQQAGHAEQAGTAGQIPTQEELQARVGSVEGAWK